MTKKINWSYALYEITNEWSIPKSEKNSKIHKQLWIKWFDEKLFNN